MRGDRGVDKEQMEQRGGWGASEEQLGREKRGEGHKRGEGE